MLETQILCCQQIDQGSSVSVERGQGRGVGRRSEIACAQQEPLPPGSGLSVGSRGSKLAHRTHDRNEGGALASRLTGHRWVLDPGKEDGHGGRKRDSNKCGGRPDRHSPGLFFPPPRLCGRHTMTPAGGRVWLGLWSTRCHWKEGASLLG